VRTVQHHSKVAYAFSLSKSTTRTSPLSNATATTFLPPGRNAKSMAREWEPKAVILRGTLGLVTSNVMSCGPQHATREERRDGWKAVTPNVEGRERRLSGTDVLLDKL
jgi:hypothetical protein